MTSTATAEWFERLTGFKTGAVPSSVRRKRMREFQRFYDRALRTSISFYASEILRGPEETGGKFLLGQHHVAWDAIIRENRRAIIMAARDHGKSHLAAFAYPLWMADRVAPGKLGYIVSGAENLAQDMLNKIRMEIIGGGENGGPNPKLAHLLPFKRDKASRIKFANGSEIRAKGFGGRIRGGHPWWMVCDDVLTDDHIYSELLRKKAIDFYLSALSNMVVPGGQLLVVGTPMHQDDLYAYLKDTGVYHFSRFPAIYDGKPLWPERYNQAALDFKKKEVRTEIRWSREFLCLPISDEASLFPSYLFESPDVLQPYPLGLPAAYWDNLGYDRYIGVDLAMSSSASADFFVIFVFAYDPKTRTRWVVDIIRRKGLGYQEQVDSIVNACDKYQPVFAFVEANQYQRVITDMVVRSTDAPIKAFYTTGRVTRQITTERRGMKGQTYMAAKHALDQGVPSLRMLFEQGKMKIPWAEDTRDIVRQWIAEMQAFGWVGGKLQGIGSHDDTVLASWIAERAIQTGLSRQAPSFIGPDAAPQEEDFDPIEDETGEEPDFFGGGAGGWRPDEGINPLG